MVNALKDAGFQIFATYPIHTENPNNPVSRGKASFFTSILIFCCKRIADRSAYLDDLVDDIQEKVRKRVKQFIKYGIRGADLTMAALGPALEVLTSYSDLKTIAGELGIVDVLALTNKSVVEESFKPISRDIHSFDGSTQLYLYARKEGMMKIPFDTLQILCKSLNIDVPLSSDLLDKSQSGRHTVYMFNSFDARDLEKSKLVSFIDYIHYGFQQFETGGEKSFWDSLASSPYNRQTILNTLSAISSGIYVEGDRVSNKEDADAKRAQNILAITSDYIPTTNKRTTQQTQLDFDKFTK